MTIRMELPRKDGGSELRFVDDTRKVVVVVAVAGDDTTTTTTLLLPKKDEGEEDEATVIIGTEIGSGAACNQGVVVTISEQERTCRAVPIVTMSRKAPAGAVKVVTRAAEDDMARAGDTRPRMVEAGAGSTVEDTTTTTRLPGQMSRNQWRNRALPTQPKCTKMTIEAIQVGEGKVGEGADGADVTIRSVHRHQSQSRRVM